MNNLKFLANIDENQLKTFSVGKSQKNAPKTKKEKRAEKRVVLRTKIEARHGIRDDEDEDNSNEESKFANKSNKKIDKSDVGNVENQPRQTFTKGWMESFSVKEALPIKQNSGKVIRTVNQIKEEKSDDENESEEEENEVVFEDGFRAVKYPDVVNSNTDSYNSDDDEGEWKTGKIIQLACSCVFIC